MKFSTATLLALMIAGCSNSTPDGDTGSSRSTDSATSQPAAPAQAGARPASIVDTVKTGGASVTSRMKLVGENLPFTTYYPEDEMTSDVSSSEEGTGLRFLSKINGEPSKDVSIHFFFPPGPETVENLNQFVTGEKGAAFNADWALQGSAQMSCPWAAISYRFADNRLPGVTGSICIGQHNGEAFYMITHYPAEHAALLESQAARILSHIRWKDGTALRKE